MMKLSINILIKLSINILIKLSIKLSIKKKKGKQRKNEFSSRETMKQVIFVYGMIISVKRRHIKKTYSDDDSE